MTPLQIIQAQYEIAAKGDSDEACQMWVGFRQRNEPMHQLSGGER